MKSSPEVLSLQKAINKNCRCPIYYIEYNREYIFSLNLVFTKKSNNSGEKWHFLGLKSFLSYPHMI